VGLREGAWKPIRRRRLLAKLAVQLGLFAIAALVIFEVAGVTNVVASGSPFRDIPAARAIEEARRGPKPLFIDFYTTWCGPCRKLDDTTWEDSEVRRWLSESVVAIKVDAERDSGLASRHGVRAYPTLLLLAPDGEELQRVVGYVDAHDFLSRMRAPPESVDTLRSRKAELEAKIRGEDFASGEEALDFLALARRLHEPPTALELLVSLKPMKERRTVKAALAEPALNEVAETRRYEEARPVISTLKAGVLRSLGMAANARFVFSDATNENLRAVADGAVERARDNAGKCFEVLLGLERGRDAAAVASRLLEVDPGDRSMVTLSRHARASGKDARALLETSVGALEEPARERVLTLVAVLTTP
jgi:thiol-disulfide isomerase/thioredoxin